MFYATAIFIAIAVGMQVISVRSIQQVSEKTKGLIRSRRDLLLVRSAINMSMRLAVVYIGLFVLFVVLLAVFVGRGTPIVRAGLSLFVFGIVTLPVGLMGKKFEKRIRSMKVETDDPAIAETFERWLIQWNQARLQLPD
jgi:hypothetical protein